MIPKQIIEKAIEGGWRPEWRFMPNESDENFLAFIWRGKGGATMMTWQEIALDSTFWRSLENATGKTARAMYLDFCSAVWDADTDKFWSDKMGI